jgi:hypothetical protein
VRDERSRTKKLIAAFHFQFANEAGWKCGECRRQGLEQVRRCGWIELKQDQPRRPVWARRHSAIEECPRSHITAQSVAWLEAFYAWRLTGRSGLDDVPARLADAFLILEVELMEENRDGRR